MAVLDDSEIDYSNDLVKQTRDAYAATFRKYISQHGYSNEVNHQADLFLKQLPEGGRILDVGCGPGRDVEYFADRGFQVAGVDNVEEFIAHCKERIPSGEFYTEDMQRLPFTSNSFDGVWSCTSLMHLPNPHTALTEMYRVLKPEGLAYISVLENTRDSLLTGSKYGKGAKFFRGYTQDTLLDQVVEVGLEPEDGFITTGEQPRGRLFYLNLFARKPSK